MQCGEWEYVTFINLHQAMPSADEKILFTFAAATLPLSELFIISLQRTQNRNPNPTIIHNTSVRYHQKIYYLLLFFFNKLGEKEGLRF